MNVLQTIRGAISTDYVILYECRRCGTTVDSESDDCPYCDVHAIARYEIC